MSPARSGYPALVAGLIGQWQRIVEAVAALPDDEWPRPTRLEWTTAELVAHLTGNVAYLLEALEDVHPGHRPDTPADRYYDDVPEDASEIAERARAAAHGTPAELRSRLAGTVAQGVAALAGPPDRDLVVRSAGHLLTLEDYLTTRAVEAVVHGLDLRAPVLPEPGALRATVRLLGQVLLRRAPGRSIEVRVPPYTAVQIALPGSPGPRHTRGTPPNVVESDPVTFVEVTTGRLAWEAALRSGAVRASGGRADLSPLLPLF